MRIARSVMDRARLGLPMASKSAFTAGEPERLKSIDSLTGAYLGGLLTGIDERRHDVDQLRLDYRKSP